MTTEGPEGCDFYVHPGELGVHFEESFAASRSAEVSLKKLTTEERRSFAESDAKEWEAIVAPKAVRIISPTAAKRIRKYMKHRIITSRMVRRWKPQEGTGAAPLAKSRWCVHGHKDPDSGSLMVFAPTPQTVSIMAFLQLGVGMRMHFDIADVKNAFTQSDPLTRVNGEIFVEP